MYPDLGSAAGIVITGALHLRALTLFYPNDWKAYWLQRGRIATTSKLLLSATVAVLIGNLLDLYPFAVGAIVGGVGLAGHIALLFASSLRKWKSARHAN